MSTAPADSETAPQPDEQMRWYVLKVQSNREKSIRDNILRRVKREGIGSFFGDIIIPTEKIAETKGGKKRVTEQKLYPGYIMIQMILNEESWFLVRETSGVGDFTGAGGKPIPMLDHEIQRMLGQKTATQEVTQPKIKINVESGDTVKIKDGPFEGFEGTVDSVDHASGRVNVLIEIFGRSTPAELEHWQIERV